MNTITCKSGKKVKKFLLAAIFFLLPGFSRGNVHRPAEPEPEPVTAIRPEPGRMTKLDKVHSFIEYSHYALSISDGITAAKSIEAGAIEGGMLARYIIPRDRPLPIARIGLALGTAIGFEKLIDVAWKRDKSKKGRVLLIATQCGLVAISSHSVAVQIRLMK